MNNYLNIIEKNNCFGCGACQNICPVDAIYMQEDEEGFLYPCLDEQKCIKCDKCKQVCPVLNKNETNSLPNEVLAGYSDDEERIKSSSGGIFPLLAKYILEEKKGFVCGAAFGEDLKVYHTIISDYADIDKLRGSKYVQSEIGDIFNQIKNLLKENKYVLFSGTPCQVAGLKLFLEKDYERLLTVDVVCHGVPPASLFKKYLDETFKDDKIISFNFRDKELHGWNCAGGTAVTANYSRISNNDFFDGFEQNLYLRPSCGECKFASRKRVSDITIGDFWGIWDYEKVLSFQKEGVSLVAATTAKGAEILEKIKPHLAYQNSVPLKYAKPNYPLFKSSKHNDARERFFEKIKNMSFKEALDSSLKYTAIMNFWWANNYGAICTAYAIQEVVKLLGYETKTINYIPSWFYECCFRNGISQKFAQKHLNLTSLCHTKSELKDLNKEVSTFIVGSDQVWRYGVEQLRFWEKFKNYDNLCFLSFANHDKKKISYAASFACEKYEGDYRNTLMVKWYLNRFQNISVREKDGVDICRNTFDVNAEHVLDPVFILPKENWEKIIDKSSVKALPEDGYICYYILDKIVDKNSIVKVLKSKFSKEIIDISKNFNESVEDWLFYIKNCDLFIADSFHGCCFAIIFNKPFICLKNSTRGASRFDSLFNLLGLQNRVLMSDEKIETRDDLFESIDYSKVNNILEEEKEKSINWLKNALNQENKPQISPENAMIEGVFDLLDEKVNEQENINTQNDIKHNELISLYQKNLNLLYEINYKINKKTLFNKLKSTITLFKTLLFKNI